MSIFMMCTLHQNTPFHVLFHKYALNSILPKLLWSIYFTGPIFWQKELYIAMYNTFQK